MAMRLDSLYNEQSEAEGKSYAPNPTLRALCAQSCFYAFLSLSSLIIMHNGGDNRTDMKG